MPTSFTIPKPPKFSFVHTIYSHGWSDLAPFEVDDNAPALRYVFNTGKKTISAEIRDTNDEIEVRLSAVVREIGPIAAAVGHMLRLDEPIEAFYEMAKGDEKLKWAAESNAGRLLRSPTVWEDLVKTMCTTNCSWSLTKKMVSNLVSSLGQKGDRGAFAFPTPEAMASVSPGFYRDEMRSGYRAPYFAELAESVAAGKVDPESWLRPDIPTTDLRKEIKSIKGIGDYAADNLLKLLGRYDGLALDSWLRAQYYKKHNRGKSCADKKIVKHYSKYGEWQGLAIWCDMTKDWFEGRE